MQPLSETLSNLVVNKARLGVSRPFLDKCKSALTAWVHGQEIVHGRLACADTGYDMVPTFTVPLPLCPKASAWGTPELGARLPLCLESSS